MRILRLVVLVLTLACAGRAAAEDVALTYDDLPTLSLTTNTAYARTTTQRLLAGLRRHGLPATGFVNESKLNGEHRARRIALLDLWLNAGMDLGNHGYSHMSLDKTPVEAYIADVARGDVVTKALLAKRGRTPHWFRYPYLETGTTPAIRQRFETWLAQDRYLIAPVTMENADWMFALPYDNAILRHDAANAARIRQSYLDYTALCVTWYRKAALQLLGRRPAFVFLLHASRLNADSIDAFAAILHANELRAVDLDQAMTDPAYQIQDAYAGPAGQEWLSRWSLTLHRDLPWSSYSPPPADIAAEDARLDTQP